MKIAYSHLAQHIEENPNIDQLSSSLFQLGHEHEIDGDIFDMEFTPNRGDCLSLNGLLRDLAVFYTVNLKQEIYTEKLDELLMDFENLSESTCPQISFLKLEIEQVPEIYKDSLDSYFLDLGLNKNNFFTDVSNYLSYETGQPTHCYDANKMSGKLLFHEIEKNEKFEKIEKTMMQMPGISAKPGMQTAQAETSRIIEKIEKNEKNEKTMMQLPVISAKPGIEPSFFQFFQIFHRFSTHFMKKLTFV